MKTMTRNNVHGNSSFEAPDSQYSYGFALRMAETTDTEIQSEDSRMAVVELLKE